MGVRKLALTLPAAFALHVLEEAPSFVTWFNSLVTPPISQALFLTVNAVGFAITVAVAFLVVAGGEPLTHLLGAAWVSFLMLANGLVHIVATVVHLRYCPGVITGSLVYLPLAIAFLLAIAREKRLPALVLALGVAVGALPMLLHGWLIVFRGSRIL